jgi:hypothetical protein
VTRPRISPPTIAELSVIGVVVELLLVVGAIGFVVWSVIGDFQDGSRRGELRAFAGYCLAAAVVFPIAVRALGRAGK